MWEINLTNQITSFLLSLALGIAFCLVYDILRVAHKLGLNSFWAVFFTDIIYWVVASFVTFLFLIARTNGELRGYIFVGEIIGFFLCRMTISRLFFSVLYFCFKKLLILKNIFSGIIFLFYQKFDCFESKIRCLFCRFFKRVVKTVKKVLKKVSKMLYTDKNNVSVENVVNESKTN